MKFTEMSNRQIDLLGALLGRYIALSIMGFCVAKGLGNYWLGFAALIAIDRLEGP